MDFLLTFKELLLVDDTPDDLQLGSHHEYDLFAGGLDGLSRLQLQHIHYAVWFPTHHESQLFQQVLIKVH